MSDRTSSKGMSKGDYILSVSIIGLFFFIFGFVTWLNGVLIPFLKTACELTDFQAYFVTFAFYISYLVMALPSSAVLRKAGFKNGMSAGLWIMAAGALTFIPAASTRTFGLFLLGLFIEGTGLALLQTASNPYITIIGPRESAAKRISIMGIANKFAGVIAPLILAGIILRDSSLLQDKLAKASDILIRTALLDELSKRVIIPYIIMATVLVLLGFLLRFGKLPDIETDLIENEKKETEDGRSKVWDHPNLLLGVAALFFYVGVEVIAGDTIIRYGISLGIPVESAKYYTSMTLIGMILGYTLGIIFIPKYISQANALKISAISGVALSVMAILIPSAYVVNIYFIDITTFNRIEILLPLTVLSVAALGFANALVWPAIWPLALDGLGNLTKTGSGLLIMAIAGGAILPLAYGKLADLFSTQSAYWICVPAYIFILFYAIKGYKFRRNIKY
jgi:MFS transporter, FHS family, L-fucose permease